MHSRTRLGLLVAALCAASVRCHQPQTPEQIACKKRVDMCLERCAEEPRRPEVDPVDQGCNDTQSPCEERCYEYCW